jgi:hypothetical protein
MGFYPGGSFVCYGHSSFCSITVYYANHLAFSLGWCWDLYLDQKSDLEGDKYG